METAPRICVVVPVYNHGGTVVQVVRESRRLFPVIVVDDGSTDQGPASLAHETGITLMTLPSNRGKAAALKAGFAKAEEAGFTHAITLDADGQHAAESLADFAAACRAQPQAFVVGVRDLKAAGAPWVRRLSNTLSAFWFRFETGVRLADVQCGYRVYPLAAARSLHVKSERYAFELEILVKAAWAGISLRSQPVQADYAAETSRLSHFHPLGDFLRIFCVHTWLAAQALCIGDSRRCSLAKKQV
jgi:glycosyltransferase involved in cell wall biosynthesis